MLYLVTFCLPRFLDRPFNDKFVTLFHELYHIGPAFDGDLRRHEGRCAIHTHSKRRYDAHMAQVKAAQEADAEASGPSSYSSDAPQQGSAVDEETLRKLREQFGGN